jgi:preprotein translocase subunit SecA
MVSKAIERSQTQVESQNFELRKNVLKYDEVMNRQREVIYSWRSAILRGEKGDDLVREWIDEVVAGTVEGVATEELSPSKWDWEELNRQLNVVYPSEIDGSVLDRRQGLELADLVELAQQEAHEVFDGREEEFGKDAMREIERRVVLSVIDNKWREHLAEMDYLRSGIGLRAMGQRDPLVEYQREGYDMFSDLVDSVKADTVRYLFHVQIAEPEEQQRPKVTVASAAATASQGASKRQAVSTKVGRNDPCPCGSGKKYKRCHGAPGAAPAAG